MSTTEQLQQRRIVHRAASSMLCYPEADVLRQLPTIAAALLALPTTTSALRRHVSSACSTICRTGSLPICSATTLTSSTSRPSGASTCRTTPTAIPGDAEPSSPNSRRDTAPAASSSTLVESCPTTSPSCSSTPRSPTRPTARACCRTTAHRSSCSASPCSTSTRRYAAALEAVCATLPGPSPTDTAAVMRMAQAGPPREEVGLEPVAFGAGR